MVTFFIILVIVVIAYWLIKDYKRRKVEEELRIWESEIRRKYKKDIAECIINGKVRIGMTSQMCIESWGEPDEINKSIHEAGVDEQWCYNTSDTDTQYLYIDNGILTAIHS